jgi:hypothetical protein
MALSVKQLNTSINTWGASVKRVKVKGQELLVECACHAFADKNVDPFTNMVNAAESLDRKTMIAWIVKHAPATWVQEKGAFKWNKSFEGDFDRAALMAASWWAATPKTTEIKLEIDILEAVRSLVKRMEKEAALEVEVDGVKTKRVVKHQELLAAVTKLANDTEYADKSVVATEEAK